MSESFGDWEKLEIRSGKLFFDDRPVVTEVKLPTWALAAAWLAAISSMLTVAVTAVAYFDSISQNMGWSAKARKSYLLIERTCDIEVHEHLIGKELKLVRIPHPCQQTQRTIYPAG